jgi:hypothetical protein
VFKEILYIIPKIPFTALNAMERSLNSRFVRVAKKFAKGLTTAVLGGGTIGLGLALIDKLLNPLKATQDAINNMLQKSDDIVTNAKQFGTTEGNLARLHAFAGLNDVTEEGVDTLLQKFQLAVAEAAADPNKVSPVRQFVGEKDIAAAFFEFIQSLQKIEDTNKKVLIEQELFGEKLVLKNAELFNADFIAQSKLLEGAPNSEKLTPAIQHLGGLQDQQKALEQVRILKDFVDKAKIINEEMINLENSRLQIDRRRENDNIQAYKTLSTIDQSITKMAAAVEKISVQIASFFQNSPMKKISESRALRAVLPWWSSRPAK